MFQQKYSLWDPLPVDPQTTNKTRHMDSKYPQLPLCSERTGVKSHDRGKWQLVDRYPWYRRTSFSYSDTIDTGATTHAYTKEETGIDTGMVQINIKFDNVTATPDGIRFKHPDGNISQVTHFALLKLPFLPVDARRVHLFYTLASGSLLSLGNFCDSGCIFQGKIFLHGVRSASTTFLWKLNKDYNQYQDHEGLQSLNSVIYNPSIAERIKFYHASLFLSTLQTLAKTIDAG